MRQRSPGCMIHGSGIAAERGMSDCTIHGSTRRFHSYAVLYMEAAGRLPVLRPCGRYTTGASCGKALSREQGSLPSSLCAANPVGLFRAGTPRNAAVRAVVLFGWLRSCAAHARFFLFLLYSERGLRMSRQSRSPRSSAIISTSAVAILVATGILYISHIRCSSLSDSL